MVSPYSAGGGGTHFEARVVAYYLASVLSEVPVRGLPGIYAVDVRTQRAAFGELLDDIIVTGISGDSRETKLHLQIKSTLTFTENDDEWADILRRAWDTFSAEGFDPVRERVGVGIGAYNTKVDRHYQAVLNWAAHSVDGEDFVQRIDKEDFSSEDKRTFIQAVRNVLARHVERVISNDELWGLLRCFVIIHFDFQSEQSSRDAANVIDRLQGLLASDKRGQASQVWNYLIQRAGQLIPAGGSANRSTLTEQLAAEGLPTGSALSFWKDVQAIHRESERALSDIKSDIHKLKLHRPDAYLETRDALTDSRFIQIVGEPGTGKSALLKEIAEESVRIGPVFVLKDSRIHPRGWSAHAHVLKVSDNVPTLLREFGCCGEPILFIDGIDKITDPAVQLTVNDLVRAIANNDNLIGWRILVSVREQNLKHLETWLDPDAIRKLPLKTVTVTPFGEEELRVIAEHFPRLQPLLLQTGGVDIIVKRPFFLAALLTLAGRDGATQLPATEVELLKLWWELGGSDQRDSSSAQHRRNALMQLAENLAPSPNSPILISAVAPEPLEELKSSGVVRDQNLGHSVVFTHDIYEEWALCELLIRHQADISGFLKTIGEPQALIRPMQLLGAYALETNSSADEWKALYEETGVSTLRPVWQRAILTSCIQSIRTTEILEKLSDYLLEGEYERLKRLLLAIRTLEVIPNPLFLDEKRMPDLDPVERARYAHHTAVPKALTWVRFLDWLMPHIGSLPPVLIQDLLPLFATWQGTYAGRRIRHCREIGEIAHCWLIEFEDAIHPPRFDQRRDPFGMDLRHDDESEIEKSLRSLFLSSAGDIPTLVTEYLRAKAANRDRWHLFRDDILRNCSALIRHLPTELVDFILEVFLERPDDRDDHWGGYSEHLIRELGVSGHHQFYPASPVQLPFLGLLRQHETQGLRLIRELCNHSISIWRWAHTNDWHRQPQTPLPLQLRFPWGKQTFWGDGQVYLWYRGYWGNDAVKSGLMALEQWAFEQIEQGAKFDEIFQKVIQGNESVAALGLAASLCLAHHDKSIECSLPLITCPHLWKWDIARIVQDSSSMPPNEIGNWHQYRPLLNAVRALNRKKHRKQDIRNLVPYFVYWHDQKLTKRYVKGIRRFPKHLPFEYAEEKTDPAYVSELSERMELFVEQGDPQHWKTTPTDDGKHVQIWNDPPSLKAEKYQRQQNEHSYLNECLALALWAQKSLDDGKLDELFTVEQGIAKAKELDSVDLFERYQGSRNFAESQRAAGVVGTAFVVARFAKEDAWSAQIGSWCLDVLDRAATVAELHDNLFVRGASLTMHPAVFAAHGYSALLARGYESKHCKSAILSLAVDALEEVVSAVFVAARLYAAQESNLYWVLLDLGIRQCIVPFDEIPNYHSTQWDEREAARMTALIERAERYLETGTEPELPSIPMPWVKGGMQSAPSARDTKEYAKNNIVFLSHLAEKIIFQIVLDPIFLNLEKRHGFLVLTSQLLNWTIQEIVPPFATSKRDYDHNVPYEWVFEFSSWCGKVCAHLSDTEVRTEILARVFASDNETAVLIMQSLMLSFVVQALLDPPHVRESNIGLWKEMTDWVFDNPEWQNDKAGRYLDREFQSCAFATLFCVAPGFSPLTCMANQGWTNLRKFQSIIERAVREFGLHRTLYLAVTAFLKKGGFELLPEPALAWLKDIALAKKQDQTFWRLNGDDTVEIMTMLAEKKGDSLEPVHREMLTLILDILVDNGVRGAGFLQQELLRA
jgi:hypothetical protein